MPLGLPSFLLRCFTCWYFVIYLATTALGSINAIFLIDFSPEFWWLLSIPCEVGYHLSHKLGSCLTSSGKGYFKQTTLCRTLSSYDLWPPVFSKNLQCLTIAIHNHGCLKYFDS